MEKIFYTSEEMQNMGIEGINALCAGKSLRFTPYNGGFVISEVEEEEEKPLTEEEEKALAEYEEAENKRILQEEKDFTKNLAEWMNIGDNGMKFFELRHEGEIMLDEKAYRMVHEKGIGDFDQESVEDIFNALPSMVKDKFPNATKEELEMIEHGLFHELEYHTFHEDGYDMEVEWDDIMVITATKIKE